MKTKETIDRIFNILANAVQCICACLLLVMIVDVSIQVIGRLMLIKSPWTEEVATYSLIWMVFIGSIAVLIKGEHLCVDLFLVRYKPNQRRVVRIFIDLVILVFCGMLFIFGVKLCSNPIILNGKTPALAISRLWIYLSLPISMAFNTLYALYDTIVAVTDLATGGKVCPVKEEEV